MAGLPFRYDVFLSHSDKDKEVVREVATRLRQDGLRVWFDEWVLKPGDSIPANVNEGLERSRVLVLCMSFLLMIYSFLFIFVSVKCKYLFNRKGLNSSDHISGPNPQINHPGRKHTLQYFDYHCVAATPPSKGGETSSQLCVPLCLLCVALCNLESQPILMPDAWRLTPFFELSTNQFDDFEVFFYCHIFAYKITGFPKLLSI